MTVDHRYCRGPPDPPGARIHDHPGASSPPCAPARILAAPGGPPLCVPSNPSNSPASANTRRTGLTWTISAMCQVLGTITPKTLHTAQKLHDPQPARHPREHPHTTEHRNRTTASATPDLRDPGPPRSRRPHRQGLPATTGHTQRTRPPRYLPSPRQRLRGVISGVARTNSAGIPAPPANRPARRPPPGATPRAQVTRPHRTRRPDQLQGQAKPPTYSGTITSIISRQPRQIRPHPACGTGDHLSRRGARIHQLFWWCGNYWEW
jgi:hypothetical protein